MRIIIDFLCVLTSIAGVIFASRQIYLQNYSSPDAAECGVSLQYMMQILPISEVVQKVFAGSAECTQRGWEFLRLTMAEWTLLWFVGFLILTLCVLAEEFNWTQPKKKL
jgi:disulfide bond formation protein DsbB